MSATVEPDAYRVLEALAVNLRARVREQRRAEERLAGFAFRESGAAVGSVESGAAPATDWRYYLARTFREASEPSTLALLLSLRSGERPLRELGEDHLAVADQVGRLATAGLVSRPLDSERVSLAPLGEAVLALYDALEARLSAGPDGDGRPVR
ncbi:MAG: hypothetical protein XU10_C0014G0005 [Chloroflexi bacterium CSP1-4]|nr:MAG: hypothetical protein XU10_C0014G0005 [Chloroflexi bacterium CSP1-4]